MDSGLRHNDDAQWVEIKMDSGLRRNDDSHTGNRDVP
jgi:hypothetical protein